MPYKSFRAGSKWEVYKVDDDGQKTGGKLGTHDDKGKADAQVRALYAAEDAIESHGEPRTSDVHEVVTLTEAELQPDTYTASVRLITSGWNKSRTRYYRDQALTTAAPLWEGVKAYADHPGQAELKNRPERSVRDIVGLYENVRHTGGVTRADFRVLGAAREWLWPLIEESVRTQRDIVGLSINALGRTVKGEAEGHKGLIVEAITHANSVDVVTEPGAGGGIEHLLMADDGWTEAVLQSLRLWEIWRARPDLKAAALKEWQEPRDSQVLAEATDRANRAEQAHAQLEKDHRTTLQELDELRKQHTRLQQEVVVDRLLMTAQLPKQWKDAVRAELLEAAPEEWERLLEREVAKAKAVGRPRVPVTGAGRAAPPPLPTFTPSRSNPVTDALGLTETVRPGEDYRAWLERQRRQEHHPEE